jgi:ATP-dependent Lon protease
MLKNVKERILEYLAVMQLRREAKVIKQKRDLKICVLLVPRSRKTSKGKSIARA